MHENTRMCVLLLPAPNFAIKAFIAKIILYCWHWNRIQ